MEHHKCINDMNILGPKESCSVCEETKDVFMGVSEWKNMGIKYKYWEFYNIHINIKIENLIKDVNSGHFGTKHRAELILRLTDLLKEYEKTRNFRSNQ